MILITGATGHIGNVLVKKLSKLDTRVRVLVRDERYDHILNGIDNIEQVRADVRDISSLEKAFEGISLVYHLAAKVSIMPNQTSDVLDINYNGTTNIIEMCIKHRARLVYVSSIHALEDIEDKTLIVNENTDIIPERAIGKYGQSKALATLAVLDAVRQRQLHAVIVMPTGVIGPFDYRNSLMGRTLSLYQSGMPFVIGKYNFVDVRDVADSIISASTNGLSGEMYILGGHTISISKLKLLMDKHLARRRFAIDLPKVVVDISEPFARLSYYLTRIPPLLTQDSKHILFSNSNISSKKAKEILGHSPRKISETLKDFCNWKNNYDVVKLK